MRAKQLPASVPARVFDHDDVDMLGRPLTTARVRCGRCGGALPMLVRAHNQPAVAGLATPDEWVLTRPSGWRWDGTEWRLTRGAERMIARREKIMTDADDRRADALRFRNTNHRYGRPGARFDVERFSGVAGPGLLLPVRLQCPHPACRVMNIISADGSATR